MTPDCGMFTRRVLGMLLCVSMAAFGAGCAKARAQTSPEGPPLRMPEPPPRVLVPTEEPPLAVAPVAPPQLPDATKAPVAPPQPPLRAGDRPEEEPQPPPTAVAPPPAPAEPPKELRTVPSPGQATSEATVRGTLAQAARDLSRVDYAKLTNDGRAQYDQSRRFAQQAEQALRARNVVFAATLADKAATLAAQLPGAAAR